MAKLITVPAVEWPRKFGWLVPGENCSELAMQILLRADRDIGIVEVPNGSNRGTRLDRMNKRAGTPLASWWCAIWVGLVWADCGALVPANYPGTDYWLPFVKEGGAKAKPEPGDAIVYGLRKPGPVVAWGDAHHIGIVARVPEPGIGQHFMLSIEGNRGYAGTTNDGQAVDIGPVTRKDILGFVSPRTTP